MATLPPFNTGANTAFEEARPVVNIFIGNIASPHSMVYGLCLGLEEEGIPWQSRPMEMNGEDDINTLAKKAADLSKLNVGLAVDETRRIVVLHHRDLPEDKPLLTLSRNTCEAKEIDIDTLRIMGANAARLVKGDPLLLQEDENEARQPDENEEKQADNSERERSHHCTLTEKHPSYDFATKFSQHNPLSPEEERVVELIVKSLQAQLTNRGEV